MSRANFKNMTKKAPASKKKLKNSEKKKRPKGRNG